MEAPHAVVNTMACRRATQLAMRRALVLGRSEAPSTAARGLATRAETRARSIATASSGDWASGSLGRGRTEAGAAGSVYARGALRRGFAADAEASDDKKDDDAREPCPRMVRLADDICGLTLLEVHDLTEILKMRLGLAAMPMMGMPMGGVPMGGAPAAGGAAAAAPEEAAAEKTEFDVKLASFDAASKIKVIKEVRAITELGLKEAKDLVEGAPAALKKGIKKEEAEAIKEKLAKVGGVVAIE